MLDTQPARAQKNCGEVATITSNRPSLRPRQTAVGMKDK
jgi:hypothetical protein